MTKHTPGPKELQRIALRERRYNERGPGARRLAKARSKPDTSDIPETREAWFKNAKLMPKAPAAAKPPQEMTMKTKAKKTPSKKRTVSEAAANLRAAKKTARKPSAPKTKPSSKTAATANARTKVAGESVRAGSKLAIVAGLLQRPEGCTGKEILDATGWPTVSVPQQAKAAGLVLSKEKDGSVTRYRGAVAPAG